MLQGYLMKAGIYPENPDVAQAKIRPSLHYLRYGGFEGRNPSSKFYSAAYLQEYPDVKSSHINPLAHYLKYGKAEGRQREWAHWCPVCSTRFNSFSPHKSYQAKNREKYGYPFTFDDLETMNADEYHCPSCPHQIEIGCMHFICERC